MSARGVKKGGGKGGTKKEGINRSFIIVLTLRFSRVHDLEWLFVCYS